jgi:hypothetical protein
LLERAGLCLAPLLRGVEGRRLGVRARLRAPGGQRACRFAFAHRRERSALRCGLFFRRDAPAVLGIGAHARQLRSGRLEARTLFGGLGRALFRALS